MRILTRILVLLTVAGLAAPVSAAVGVNAHKFVSNCMVMSSDHDSELRFSRCEELVNTVRQKFTKGDVHGLRSCIPAQVSDYRLMVTAVRWIQENPGNHHAKAHAALAAAYSNKWPCD